MWFKELLELQDYNLNITTIKKTSHPLTNLLYNYIYCMVLWGLLVCISYIDSRFVFITYNYSDILMCLWLFHELQNIEVWIAKIYIKKNSNGPGLKPAAWFAVVTPAEKFIYHFSPTPLFRIRMGISIRIT